MESNTKKLGLDDFPPAGAVLTFPGKPKAVQSVRIGRTKTGFPVAFQTNDVRCWKADIRAQARQQLAGDFFHKAHPDYVAGQPLFGCGVPVVVDITFAFLLPKSAPKELRNHLGRSGLIYRVKRPDLIDNLCKGLCDALTGIIWADDAQVVALTSQKCYVLTDAEEGTRIAVLPASGRGF